MEENNVLPEGYHLLSINDMVMHVGIDFSHIGKKALSRIEFRGRPYERGLIRALAPELANQYCSVREYLPLPTKIENDTKGVAFAAELKALLEKYNVTIMWTCGDGSDTHGIYDENMVIQDNETNDNLLEIDGSCIGLSDL